jgi:hypothetical protein
MIRCGFAGSWLFADTVSTAVKWDGIIICGEAENTGEAAVVACFNHKNKLKLFHI